MASIKSLLDQQLAINKKLANDALQKKRDNILNMASKLAPVVVPAPDVKDDELKEGSVPWLKNALDAAKVEYKAKASKADLQKLLNEVSS